MSKERVVYGEVARAALVAALSLLMIVIGLPTSALAKIDGRLTKASVVASAAVPDGMEASAGAVSREAVTVSKVVGAQSDDLTAGVLASRSLSPVAAGGIRAANADVHEEWTALGLYRHIRDNSPVGSAAYWDAQCAIDILTGGVNTTGHVYPAYEGPEPDASRANISVNVDMASRDDAVSLDNFKAALDFVDEYNRYRAKENTEAGTALTGAIGAPLATNIGINCRLMAIAAVQLDFSADYYASGGHSQAYFVGENLAWGYSDPFVGWYDEEKAEFMAGDSSGAGHYFNIVDHWCYGTYNPCAATGFAVNTAAPVFGVAHGQVFHTTSGYAQFNPSISYSTDEFRSRWFDDYYQAQVDAGMNGTTTPGTSLQMYRLYNPNSGEHFYTADVVERDNLSFLGWAYEGVGWVAPAEGVPVWRLYNPNAGDHHYTTNVDERNFLTSVGWRYEGVGWLSAGPTPLYRLYNPNATGAGAHHYTTSLDEKNFLVGLGWRDEGVGWYGVAVG